MSKHLKRCKSCSKWTDGASEFCLYCGFEHDKVANEERQARAEKGDHRVPIIQVYPNDKTWVKILKRPVQLVQLILYGIIAFLVYLTTVFAH